MNREVLQLINIDKSYGEKIVTKVLNNINLTFYEGEFTAIIGQSGSGKSTLLNIIGSLDKPTSGDILLEEIISHTLLIMKWLTLEIDPLVLYFSFTFYFLNLLF